MLLSQWPEELHAERWDTMEEGLGDRHMAWNDDHQECHLQPTI